MSKQITNLATQYRPTKFSEVVGQDLAVNVLKKIALADGIAARSIFLKGAFGAGKCVAPDTIIRTKDGLRLANQITNQEFEIVGKYNQFVARENNKNQEVYKVTTTTGRQIRVTSNHPILVTDEDANLYFITPNKLKKTQHFLCLDITSDLSYLCTELDFAAYSLGVEFAKVINTSAFLRTSVWYMTFSSQVAFFKGVCDTIAKVDKTAVLIECLNLKVLQQLSNIAQVMGFLPIIENESILRIHKIHELIELKHCFHVPDVARAIPIELFYRWKRVPITLPGRSELSAANIVPDLIQSIEIEEVDYTIDLQCRETPIFYTDGIITHNTTIARIFAKAMNCEEFKKTGDICNECAPCNEAALRNSQLFYEFDASVVGTVEGIKNITAMLEMPPSGRRVVVLDECHAITKQALNALLKILEEGIKDTIFLFASTEDIIETIKSRSLCIDIGLIHKDLIKERVSYVMNDRGIVMSPEHLELLAIKSRGHMRDALSILQLYELCGEKALETPYFHIKNYIIKCLSKQSDALEQLPNIMKYSTVDIRNAIHLFIKNVLTPQPGSVEEKMHKSGASSNLFSFFFSPVAQQAMKDEIGIEILLKSLYERTKL